MQCGQIWIKPLESLDFGCAHRGPLVKYLTPVSSVRALVRLTDSCQM